MTSNFKQRSMIKDSEDDLFVDSQNDAPSTTRAEMTIKTKLPPYPKKRRSAMKRRLNLVAAYFDDEAIEENCDSDEADLIEKVAKKPRKEKYENDGFVVADDEQDAYQLKNTLSFHRQLWRKRTSKPLSKK